MDQYKIISDEGDALDLIRPLWEKLNLMHQSMSPHFTERFRNMRWEDRRSKIAAKASSVLLEYAVERATGNIVGYCISTIDKENQAVGEIDSLFIEDNHRNSGIGSALIERATEWLTSRGTTTQKLLVGVGNENAIEFYKKFGFYPLHIVLQKIDK